jgi:uncharacterized protein YbjT (DUF2867 family)
MNILITGATGNVGQAIFSSFSQDEVAVNIIAGVRNTAEAVGNTKMISGFSKQEFDFGKPERFSEYLKGIEVLFLLRPPNIADVEKVFQPLIDTAKEVGIQHIVFLSVQGAEKQSYIPHHKIEKLIVDSKIPYTFLRPAYFMQNFTTTLRKDIVDHHKIYLPAGNAKFTIVDVNDVGAVAAKILLNASEHQNKAYELTNNELLTFSELAEQISKVSGTNVRFVSPNLLAFIFSKWREGQPWMYIFVLIMLHYFPRFRAAPKTTTAVEKLLNRNPISFQEWLKKNW